MASMTAPTTDDLALQEWQANRLPEALRLLEIAIAQQETADRWNNWASVQFRGGHARAAELGFRRALELEPGFSQAAANLGAVLAADGKLDASVAMLERSLTGNGMDSVQHSAALKMLAQCRTALAQSPQPKFEVPRDQIYAGYKPEELSLIREHFCLSPAPATGFIVDSLGVKTRGSSLWNEVQFLVGTVMPPPIPNDFHAEAIEWIGLLKSVRSAKGSYAAMELGAGWGPWVVAGATAARNAGITNISLLAVEGDPGHFAFMRQHFIDNNLNPDNHALLHAAVGVKAGRARWPRVDPRNTYGSRPIFASDGNTSQTFEIPVFSISDLLYRRSRWDLVHVDVQGDEVVLCEAGLGALTERVRWLVIGTHSRMIEGLLINLLLRAGWVLENEKPVIFDFQVSAPNVEALTRIDGTQVWRNPRLD